VIERDVLDREIGGEHPVDVIALSLASNLRHPQLSKVRILSARSP